MIMKKLLNGELIDMTQEEIDSFEAERSPTPTEAVFAKAIQTHIDATAKAKNYGDGTACASYSNSTNPAWAAEAQAFIAWRDAVWVYVYTQLAAVQSNQRTAPTVQGFISELPAMVWPS